MIQSAFQSPYPGILVHPLAKPPYDANESLSRSPLQNTSVPSLPGLNLPSARRKKLVFQERFPVLIKRRRFRFWHKTVVNTDNGTTLRTSASRIPRLMRSWGLWSLAAAALTAHGLAETPGTDAMASAFWVNLFVWFGLTFYGSGAFFGVFSKKKLILETTKGEPVYQVRRLAGGIFSSHYSIVDATGYEHVRLARSGTQFFKRHWRMYDRTGGAGPEFIERSYLTALTRKMLGHLWGNFRARYNIWYNGITVGSIEREGFTNDGYRIDFWKEVPNLDPKLVSAAIAFIDHQDPERWHPWFN